MRPVITPAPEGALKVATLRSKSEQVEFALRKLEQNLGPADGALIMLEYSDNREWVEKTVLAPVQKRYTSAEVVLCPLSLTSAVHMGPGTWAVAFLPTAGNTAQDHRTGADGRDRTLRPTLS
jgi:fatty acid kinase/fatty acid kinase fatty acid binding subunit